MPELRNGRGNTTPAANPLLDSDDDGDGIFNTPHRPTAPLSPALTASVGIALAVFIAAVAPVMALPILKTLQLQ